MTTPPTPLSDFPTVLFADDTSQATVPAEVVAPGIAIAPYLDTTNGYQLGGGFTVVHATSGKRFIGGQACIECARHVARLLAVLPVGWTQVDVTDKNTVKVALGAQHSAAVTALQMFDRCHQAVCDPEEPGPCGACGLTGQHASYCIHVVGPMVAELNARAGVR